MKNNKILECKDFKENVRTVAGVLGGILSNFDMNFKIREDGAWIFTHVKTGESYGVTKENIAKLGKGYSNDKGGIITKRSKRHEQFD